MQHTPAFIKISLEAKNKIKEIDVNTVKHKLDNSEKIYFIDVREESEWVQGHLPQAIHLSKGIIERDLEKKIPDVNAEIILYCGGGSRSALAAMNVQQMGYTNVWSMAGGFRGWLQAGYGLETLSCEY